jgi:hypothetical protein
VSGCGSAEAATAAAIYGRWHNAWKSRTPRFGSAFAVRYWIGGWGEIRTHGTLAGPAVFKTAALNHSATHPHNGIKYLEAPLKATPILLPRDCYRGHPERFSFRRCGERCLQGHAAGDQLGSLRVPQRVKVVAELHVHAEFRPFLGEAVGGRSLAQAQGQPLFLLGLPMGA